VSARHQEVANDLRRRIRAGSFPVGSRLPPETRLATQYRVSVPTLREALGVLQAEGLLQKFQGRGNFVREPPPRIEYPGAGGSGLHVVAGSADKPAGSDLASRLGTVPYAPVTEYVYVAHRDECPQSVTHVYVPHAVARLSVPTTGSSPWGDDVLDQLVITAGVQVACETHQVTARFPTEAEAQSLRIALRTPVLAIERTLLTQGGKVIAYAAVVLPGDRAQVAFATRTSEKGVA
jgi:GntR family transcriptional regulator